MKLKIFKAYFRKVPSLAEIILVCAALLILWQFSKPLVGALSVTLLVTGLLAMFTKSFWSSNIYRVTLLLWLASILLPFDVKITNGRSMSVRILPVRFTHGLASNVMGDAQELVRDKDYIIYDSDVWPMVPPKWCLVIQIP